MLPGLHLVPFTFRSLQFVQILLIFSSMVVYSFFNKSKQTEAEGKFGVQVDDAFGHLDSLRFDFSQLSM